MPQTPRLTASLDDNRYEDALIKALRTRNGRATLGDIIATSGLPQGEAETHLRRLTGLYKSHLEVDDQGEILYVFDTSFERRDQDTSRTLYLIGQKLWAIFKVVFKVVIMLVLVLYAILYIALMIALLFSGNDNDSDSGSSSSSGSRGFGGLGWIFWSSGGSRPGYSSTRTNSNVLQRGSTNESPNANLPFYKRVFAFVFGPEANDDDIEERIQEKQLLAFIRDNKGVVSTTEIMTQTGWTRLEAEEHTTRLLVDYDGKAHVTPEGTILYIFESLLVSAGREPNMPVPDPIWRRLESPQYITGNSGGTNAAIVALNVINFIGALIAPSILMPQLGIQPSFIATAGLATFPFLFSLVFFTVPFFRSFGVRKENRSRREANIWRLSLRELIQNAKQGTSFSASDIHQNIQSGWPTSTKSSDFYESPSLPEVTAVLKQAAIEYGADIDPTEQGLTFHFDSIQGELNEAAQYRSMIDPSEFRLGKIVFSSAEDAYDDGADQLEDFDRQLGNAFSSPANAQKIQRENPDFQEFDQALKSSPKPSKNTDDSQSALDDFDRQLQEAAHSIQAKQKG